MILGVLGSALQGAAEAAPAPVATGLAAGGGVAMVMAVERLVRAARGGGSDVEQKRMLIELLQESKVQSELLRQLVRGARRDG